MTQKGKEMMVWGVLLVGLAAIVLGMYAAVTTPGKQAENATLQTPVSANDWKLGPDDAKVVLVEYSDLQCPACKYYQDNILKPIEAAYGDKIQVVYRHYPLSQHIHSKEAAIAAEAAGKQGKFWQMHDLLFATQDAWATSTNVIPLFVGYVQKMGVDVGRFEQDMQSNDLASKIERSIEDGNAQGIQGTPTFFLNGKAIQSPRSLDEFKQVIDAALNK